MGKAKIVSDSEILDGEPHVEGTRISAWKIHDMYSTLGMSLEEITEELPTVDLEEVKAAIGYIKDKERAESAMKA